MWKGFIMKTERMNARAETYQSTGLRERGHAFWGHQGISTTLYFARSVMLEEGRRKKNVDMKKDAPRD
jgi:hypothetical protein